MCYIDIGGEKMNYNLIDIGKRITYIREELNLTKEKFGNKFGVTGDAIYNIENARNKALNMPLILSISAQYGINKDWLLYGTGEKYVKTKKSIIDELVNTYNLSCCGEQIIRTYLELPDDKRAVIDDFVEKLANNLNVDTTLVAARSNAELRIISDDDAVRKDLENYIPPTDL